MDKGHIVTSFDAELARLTGLITQMGELAVAQIDGSVRALVRHDTKLAKKVVADDAEIDALEAEVDRAALNLMALRQPMADDLRRALAAMKIAPDIERIGDYAKNIAKRTVALDQAPVTTPIVTIPRMAQMVREMVRDVMQAFADHDIELARKVWERDVEIDESYDAVFRELLTHMMEDPRRITSCTHLLFTAKNIERIGDLATNIAERIHFQVTGDFIDEDRPKHDLSSVMVVEPREAGAGNG